MKPSLAILHHAGDENIPLVRVPSTVALARDLPTALVFVGLPCPDVEVLQAALGINRILVRGTATDTVGEIVSTYAEIMKRGIADLWIATQPGHLDRTMRIARIIYWRRGVRVHPWPSAPGSYRSPRLRTIRDTARALSVRVMGAV